MKRDFQTFFRLWKEKRSSENILESYEGISMETYVNNVNGHVF